uniref:Hypotheticial protein n=1 Tax=Schistosoma japonicum TaxID=6182 RepID=C7TXU7_SCHJA|nr:hypotheticial protein [Schistosoma japonicum]
MLLTSIRIKLLIQNRFPIREVAKVCRCGSFCMH